MEKHTWRVLQQLVPTKVYRVLKNQKEQGLDLMCALCHSAEETVPYLLCGCSAIAETIYKAKHDKMWRPITISYYQYITWYSLYFLGDLNTVQKKELSNLAQKKDVTKMLTNSQK